MLAKGHLTDKKQRLCSKLDRYLRKRLAECFFLSEALYGAEEWMEQDGEKNLGVFEMQVWRRMERIRWMDKVKNE